MQGPAREPRAPSAPVRLHYSFQVEQAELVVRDPGVRSESAETLLSGETINRNKVTTSLVADFRDQIMNPRRGSLSTFTAQWGDEIIGADFDFTASHNLASGASLVIVAFDPVAEPGAAATFRATYGIDGAVPLVGPFTDGPLRNDTGAVRLQRPDQSPVGEPGFYPAVTEDEDVARTSLRPS